MRAVGVVDFGGPDALQVGDLPEVHAEPGAVRIRVHGARADRLKNDPPPYVPGMDVAGVIDEIGPGTDTDLGIGEAVIAMAVIANPSSWQPTPCAVHPQVPAISRPPPCR